MAKKLILMSDADEKGIKLAETADQDTAVCLLQNAVYLPAKNKKLFETLLSQNKKIYALEKDVNLRGLKGLLDAKIKLIDYPDVIDIVLEHDKIINF